MRSNTQFAEDLVTFIEVKRNEKFHFLNSVS